MTNQLANAAIVTGCPNQYLMQSTVEDNKGNWCDTSAGLMSDSEDISEDDLCKLCYTRLANTIFMPCHHGNACHMCAQRCCATSCPWCRTPIEFINVSYTENSTPNGNGTSVTNAEASLALAEHGEKEMNVTGNRMSQHRQTQSV
jgi:hypothetical protein